MVDFLFRTMFAIIFMNLLKNSQGYCDGSDEYYNIS